MITAALTIWLAAAAQGSPPLQEEQEKIPVERGPSVEDLERLRPGFDPLHLVRQRPLSRAPMRVSSNNLLHALFGFLPLESAETLEEGRLDVGLFEDISSGSLEIITADWFFRYDATLLESNLVARAGFAGDWELVAGIDVSNLLENDGDIILARQGQLLIRQGDRGMAVGDFRLSGKKRLFSVGEHGSAGAIVGLKIPVSRGETDLLTSGGVDLAVGLLFTQDLGALTLHVNVGAIVPGDIELFDGEVETGNALTFGAAAVYEFAPWGALTGQLQGHQSVFQDSLDSIAILDELVVTGHLGGKFRIGSYFLDASVGTGFTDQSSDTIFTISFTMPF